MSMYTFVHCPLKPNRFNLCRNNHSIIPTFNFVCVCQSEIQDGRDNRTSLT